MCAQSRLTLCDPMDCSPPGSSAHGILQARILAWVAISFSRGSTQPMNRTWVSCIAGRFFTTLPPGKPFIRHSICQVNNKLFNKNNYNWINSLRELTHLWVMGRMVVIRRTWKWPCVDLACCDNQENTTSIFILDTWVLIFPLIDKSPKRFSFKQIAAGIKYFPLKMWYKLISSFFVYWVTDIDKRNRGNKPICQSEKNRKTSREFNKNTKEPF